jgi:transposase InsO family protein
LADEIVKEYNVSISRACKLMDIHRSYFYYTEKKDDSEVEQAIREAAEFGDGFWKIFQRLRRDGKPWNHKKVYRVYKQMHYEKRSKLKKRLPARVKSPLVIPSEPNTTWSIDSTMPGHPTQNSIIERFNGSYRRAVLDAYIFRTLHNVRELTEAWMTDYNECRPHESLGNMTPMEYREKKKVG